MTTFKSIAQLVLIILFMSNSVLTLAESKSKLLDQYISDFTTSSAFEKQLLCEKIMWSGLSDASLFDLIEEDLKNRSTDARKKKEIDNVAWLMKALGSSGQSKYKDTLQSLASHRNSKIVKYAKEGLDLIAQHARWNPIISDTSKANPDKSEIINRYANMIRSDILELNVYAGKRIYAEKINDAYLYELLSEKILSGHKAVHKSERLKILAYAWMMRASVQTDTSTAQQVLETATVKKLRKYAKKYMAEKKN